MQGAWGHVDIFGTLIFLIRPRIVSMRLGSRNQAQGASPHFSVSAPPCFKTCSEHESTDNHRHEHPVLASQLTRSFQFLQMYSAPTLQPTASASMPRAEPAFPSSESAMGPGVFKSDCQCPEVCLVG
eukprot:scaffold41777_cov16-Tisochrysis_lutea.AAC.1